MTPVEFRRHLHRHPELSFRETESARFIAEALREAGIPCRPIAGTGVLAKIEGRGDLRRAVVLRADIDALPVPVSVTPAGHLVVDPLEPIVRRATQAFIDTWQQLCAEAEP